ncbi:MAG: prepilin-type N-terminal cleavage/methylation domain-containing protein [Planctomycetes bacterium]|nr:prepilin-type N-terminal cleavage/methylation domain-containing protein [Planctomycetota bacterium]
MNYQRPHQRRAFSLIELVVTLFVVSILMTCVVAIVMGTVEAKILVEAETRARKLGPAIVETIARDLRNAWASGPDKEVELSGSFFVAKTHGDDDAAEDELWFVTTVDSYMLYQGLHSEITEVGYYVKDNENDDGLKSLYRREDYSVDKDPSDGGLGVKLTDRLISFNVRYYERPTNADDPTAYDEVLKPGGFTEKHDWDAKDSRKLPYAARIELVLDVTSTDSHTRNKDRRIGVYNAIVRLPDYPELTDTFKLFDLATIKIPDPNAPPDPNANPNPNPNPDPNNPPG